MTEGIIGKIAVIDLAKRHMVIMDKDQILHPYTCAEPLDIILQKQTVVRLYLSTLTEISLSGSNIAFL